MRIMSRQRDASTLQKDGWSQMEGWLAELGDDDHAEPPGDGRIEPDAGDGRIEPDAGDDPRPEALAQADARARADARAEAPGEAAVTSAAVTATCLDPVPDQPSITDPVAANPPAATQRNRPRPLEAAQCSLCGITLPRGLLVPDGSQACADIQWYCKDAMSCTQRWTTARPPGPAHMPTAPDDASG
jgi:hypothetical protein